MTLEQQLAEYQQIVADLLLLVDQRESKGSTNRVITARREAVIALRGLGWTVARIRLAMGLSESTAIRATKPVRAKHPDSAKICGCGSAKHPRSETCRDCYLVTHTATADNPIAHRRNLCACGASKWRTAVSCRACERKRNAAPPTDGRRNKCACGRSKYRDREFCKRCTNAGKGIDSHAANL